MTDLRTPTRSRFNIAYEADDPDRPSPLKDIFADPDSPSPLRDRFLEGIKLLFNQNAQAGRKLFFDAQQSTAEVEVPVRGTYVAIAQNRQGALFASDIAMSGIRPRAVLEAIPTAIEPPEFKLQGFTVMPNLLNLLVVPAEPFPATFTVKPGDSVIHVHDRDGTHDVPIRWINF